MAIEYTDTIQTKSRTLGRKSVLKNMRVAGEIPAVIYGPARESQSLSVNMDTLTHQRDTFGANHVYKVSIDGQEGVQVLIHEIEREPVSNKFTHVDFFAIDPNKKVTITTPIFTTGKCIGVVEGGHLEQYMRMIKVQCLPHAIPDKIELDVTNLMPGDDIRVRDLPFAEGVGTLIEGNVAVVRVAVGGAKELDLGEADAGADADAEAGDAAAEPATDAPAE